MLRMTHKSLFLGLSLFSLLAPKLSAQDFGGQVTQDPRANLAIYDFHFDGPARGVAGLMLGTGLAVNPVRLGPFGTLFLDPLNLLLLPPIALDGKGKGALHFQVPIQSVQQLTVTSQCYFVDTQLRIALPPKFVAMAAGGAPAATKKPSYAFVHDSSTSDVQVQFWGDKGASGTIELFDQNGKSVGKTTLGIDSSGKSKIGKASLGGKIKPGYSWKVSYKASASGKATVIGKGKF